MPYRTVKPHSDRGSIRDLSDPTAANYAPTDEELRLKKLYEHAQATQDEGLKESLGFIVMPNAGDRSAFPISVYRHREYINSLSANRASQIEKTKKELEACFTYPGKLNQMPARMTQLKQAVARETILANGLIKIAGVGVSVDHKRSFRRVR